MLNGSSPFTLKIHNIKSEEIQIEEQEPPIRPGKLLLRVNKSASKNRDDKNTNEVLLEE